MELKTLSRIYCIQRESSVVIGKITHRKTFKGKHFVKKSKRKETAKQTEFFLLFIFFL